MTGGFCKTRLLRASRKLTTGAGTNFWEARGLSATQFLPVTTVLAALMPVSFPEAASCAQMR